MSKAKRRKAKKAFTPQEQTVERVDRIARSVLRQYERELGLAEASVGSGAPYRLLKSDHIVLRWGDALVLAGGALLRHMPAGVPGTRQLTPGSTSIPELLRKRSSLLRDLEIIQEALDAKAAPGAAFLKEKTRRG